MAQRTRPARRHRPSGAVRPLLRLARAALRRRRQPQDVRLRVPAAVVTLPLTVEEVPGRGLVAVALTVRAGGDDDPPGRHGTAHLVEHLMFPRGAGEDSGHVALVEEAGGMCNAETHRDHTVFHTVAPPTRSPRSWPGRPGGCGASPRRPRPCAPRTRSSPRRYARRTPGPGCGTPSSPPCTPVRVTPTARWRSCAR
ncbi:insulinase family protein [Streptomyces sp. SHP22-7]|nr:insulinase family protein [Streptomyces sp. SHP22-7]